MKEEGFMKKRSLVIIILVVIGLYGAYSFINPAVSGVVKDAETDEPIADAWVLVKSYYEFFERFYTFQYTQTDSNGRFKLKTNNRRYEYIIGVKDGYEASGSQHNLRMDPAKRRHTILLKKSGNPIRSIAEDEFAYHLASETGDSTFCESISSAQADYWRPRCYQIASYEKGDTPGCANLVGDDKALCVVNAVSSIGNPELCETFEDVSDRCYFMYVTLGNYDRGTWCNKIKVADKIGECYIELIYRMGHSNPPSTTFCNNIQDISAKQFCLSKAG